MNLYVCVERLVRLPLAKDELNCSLSASSVARRQEGGAVLLAWALGSISSANGGRFNGTLMGSLIKTHTSAQPVSRDQT